MAPTLCRFCERPAAEGGYQVAKLDRDKFVKWCMNILGNIFTDNIQDDDLICYFCVWDARFLFDHDNEILDSTIKELQWWPETEEQNEQILKLHKFYKAGVLEQCWIPLEKLKLPKDENHQENAPAKASNVQPRSDKKCIYCNELFSNGNKLAKHVSLNHAETSIRCNYHTKCVHYFKSVKEMDKHVKNFHMSPKTQTRNCIYCLRKFSSLEQFKYHMRTNHLNESIKCSTSWCGTYFKSQNDLEFHVLNIHTVAEERKKYQCSVCLKKFSDKCILDHHEAKMHLKSEHSMKCTECPAIFISQISMRRHQKLAHRFKVCPACKSEIPARYFRDHYSKVICKRCQAGFDCAGSRKKHKCNFKSQCAKCGKVYCKKSTLTHHMKMKHNISL